MFNKKETATVNKSQPSEENPCIWGSEFMCIHVNFISQLFPHQEKKQSIKLKYLSNHGVIYNLKKFPI